MMSAAAHPQPADTDSSTLRRWLLLLLVIASCWALALWWLQAERERLHERETERLQAQAGTLERLIKQQLGATQQALGTVAAQYPQWERSHVGDQAEKLLIVLAKAMPGVRILTLVDAQGRVQASSAPHIVGVDASQRDFYLAPRARPQAGLIHVSPPFVSVLGAYTMSLSQALLDAHGRFAGAIVISLEPQYYRLILESVRYSSETWSALLHGGGLPFAFIPHDPSKEGLNVLAQPGSLLERHLNSGAEVSLLRGHAHFSGDERLAVLHTLSALEHDVVLDKPLVIVVGRALATLEAPWRQQRLQLLGALALISLTSCAALALWQRRQSLIARMRQRQQRLEREAAQRMALALDGAALGLWEWEIASGQTRYDSRWCGMLGYEVEDLAPHVDSWRELLHPDDREAAQQALDDCLSARKPSYTVEFRLRHRDGHWVWIHCNGRVTARGRGGEAQQMLGTHLDISIHKQTEAQLIEQAQHTQAILDNMVDGVITIDAQGTIASFNPAASRMFGYTAEEVTGRNVSLLMPEPDASRHDAYIHNYLRGQPARVIGVGRDVDGRRKSGSIFPMSLAVSRVERHGQTMFIGLTRDITERKKAEAAIERLAFYDPLTGLPNRRLLLDRLNQTLAASQRSGRHGAVLFLDIDNFKSLNDTLGHGMGDKLLTSIAQRLQAALRAQDSVARWGGDEFVVLLQDLGSDAAQASVHAEAAAEKLMRVLCQPHQLDRHVHHSTPSIGIVVWGAADSSSEELLKRADHAMYQAKAAGRSQIRFFDPLTQAAMAERAALEADLRLAMALGQLELHFQPQVARHGQPIGAEALLRWRHPQRGWISPAVFIPLAEQTGLINQLGEWVIAQACDCLQRWSQDELLSPLTLAVNVSVHQLRQKGFLEQMQDILRRSGAPSGRLELELTESALVDDVEAMIVLMDALRRCGMRLSLDDFGTGYSSLTYLKRLPLDQLKIDKSFVDDLLTEADDRAIAHTVIQLGQSLGLEVLAEGVETGEQHALLRELGCHAFQGYHFGRPLPHDDFVHLLHNWPTAGRHGR